MLPLHEWETFYVIVGSSAAALTGLQFVVIALSADTTAAGTEDAVAVFGTPTIVHFCAVLTVAAIVAVPRHSAGSVGACLAIAGFGGLIYAIATAFRARRQTDYKPVLEDWLWHAGFPICAYATLLAAGIAALTRPTGALYVVAATTLFLLFTGIHNAWDAAVFISTRRHEAGS